MKTNEELTALKEEVKTVSKKLNELTDEEFKQVTGGDGDIDVSYNSIMQCIEAGQDRLAWMYFEIGQNSLTSMELYTIRMTFLSKFGYPIDMYGG